MSSKLYRADLEQIIIGASWFGTGGGLSESHQFSLLQELDVREGVPLTAVDELSAGDAVCCAYGVGSTAETTADLGSAFTLALATLETITKRNHVALFPAEANIELSVVTLAQSLGRAVLDADTTGGRAVPEITIDNFALYQEAITPVVAVDLNGKTLVLNDGESFVEIERAIRAFAADAPERSVAVVDHSIMAEKAKRYLSQGTFSKAKALGESILRFQQGEIDAAAVFKAVKARLLLEGTIDCVEFVSSGGFLKGQVRVKSVGAEFQLVVKNEVLTLSGSEGSLVSSPDLIVVIDAETLHGIHNSQIAVGQRCMIASIACDPRWDTELGRSLFMV